MCVTVGSLLAGPLADRLSSGDPRRVAIIPAVTTVLGAAAGAVMSLANTWAVSVVGLSVFALMTGFFIAYGHLAGPFARRAERARTTMAATRVISILLGTGLIPVMTGPSRMPSEEPARSGLPFYSPRGCCRRARLLRHGLPDSSPGSSPRISAGLNPRGEDARLPPDDRCAGEQNRDTRQGHGQIRACFDGA